MGAKIAPNNLYRIKMDIYNNLKKLVDENSNFFYKDFVTAFGDTIRIFGYHFASYSDWLNPDALECRGIAFEMNGETPVRIACRPMEKFFNLNENPFTMDIDLTQIDYYMEKEDGSLISTFQSKGVLFVKSKASLWSTQAMDAGSFLQSIYHKDLYDRCLELANDGYTCNFEYVSPTNRVVLPYDKKNLILLNVRNNDTGEYVPFELLKADPILRNYLVKAYKLDATENPEELIENIRSETDAEGVVFVMKNGLRFKLKSEWYIALHSAKSSINNNSNLFEVVVYGGSDDIKTLFSDKESLTKIQDFEQIYLDYLKSGIEFINSFKAKNPVSDRKTYALNGQIELKNLDKMEIFSVLMNAYNTKIDIVNELSTVFLKYSDKYVPEKYKTK